MEGVSAFLKSHIKPGEKLGVAVSGGIDSVCLLDIVYKTLYQFNPITVLNVEHGIRGKDSENDTLFVEQLSEKYGLPIIVKRVSVLSSAEISGRSIESEARFLRHSFFKEVVESGKADKILLAHNTGDKTEGILLHIFRGAGLGGLVGINGVDGYILRPLIDISRQQIEEYSQINGLSHVEDCTNSDDSYDRNFLRLKVLPLIRQRWDVDGALSHLSALALENEQYFNKICQDGIEKDGNAVKISCDALENDKAVSSRLILYALKAAGLKSDYENKHIELILEFKNARNGAVLDIKNGFKAAKEYGFITIFKDKEKEENCIPFGFGSFSFCGKLIIKKVQPFVKKGNLIFDIDKIPKGSVIRTRRDGDLFKPYGTGTKKLKEYFADKKIPLKDRDFIPLVCFSNRVLIVSGTEISDDIKLDSTTANAAQIIFEKESF